MLRINEEPDEPGHRRLSLEGAISGPWVQELGDICSEILGAGSRLTLDLSAISFLDAAAADLLQGLTRRGVSLMGESPFLARQLGRKTE